MIHRVKGFSVVNVIEVDVFLESPCFLYDPTNVDNLISGSSASSKPNLYIWNFWVHILLKPRLKEFEHWTEVKVTQLCLTIWDLMGCSPQGSSVHGIFQARILEWVTISFSRGSSQPRDQTQFSRITGRFFTINSQDNLNITLLVCEMSTTVQSFEHSLALIFFGTWMKIDLFQSCGHCWVFQICWHIDCSTLTEPSFRIWNSSTGIWSPPLDLFVVMLSMIQLTSHAKMSSSRWVITPSWLSRSLRPFCRVLLCTLATSS